MDEKERKDRELLVHEALSWIGTPYHHMGRVKGAGTDCGMFLLQCLENVDLIKHVDVGYYPIDWHLHRSQEKYLGWVEKYCQPVRRKETGPLPGDIVVYQFGRCISHGAMVVEWPKIIHSYVGLGVVMADAESEEMQKRQRGIYSFWGGDS